MSKVITFSRVFPAYHPKKGQPTLFAEKLINSFRNDKNFAELVYDLGDKLGYMYADDILSVIDSVEPKNHTIRSGNRWKVGDNFSPRVWSGKPYNSKQIILAPDIEIKKVWNIEVCHYAVNGKVKGVSAFIINGNIYTNWDILALNDGLSLNNLISWFNKPFKGQIICWNKYINY